MRARRARDVVLVGGGHAHVQLLRRWIMRPLVDARVTVVVDRPEAVYSGMVPGLVAGHYAPSDVTIDVRPLAKRAGARFVVAPCTAVDPVGHAVHLHERPPLHYDLASLDIGSAVAGLDTPGVREHTLPTRPIGAFAERIGALFAAAGTPRVVVVGGGAGGVELALAAVARLRRQGVAVPSVTLVHDGAHLLPGHGPRLAARARRACERRGVKVLAERRVTAVHAERVALADGGTLPHDLCLWVTGAAAPALLRASGLPCDERGFVWVGPTLEVPGHEGLFAAGDCAVPTSWPAMPKAGVYAVRQGPRLEANLRARLAGRRLTAYRPQRDFLTLLNGGDGTALGGKWGVAAEGRWVMRWKDRIDRRFVERFQVLDADGAPTTAFRHAATRMTAAAGMTGSADDMVCGGCAAKVARTPLARALGRLAPRPDPDVLLGLERPDDVAALRRPTEVLVATVDQFPAFTDDPWLVGRVAAANALSDVQAKGVTPRLALALVGVPAHEDPEHLLVQVLTGARTVLDREGVSLAGGHTTVGPQLTVGFSVMGFAPTPEALVRHDGVRAGDALVLARALGTGVLLHADMAGRASGRWMAAAMASMERGNAAAARVARTFGVHAATDVTGFGLAGHLAQMIEPSGLAATVVLESLPALPGALALLRRGERSTFHEQNRAVLTDVAVPAALAGRAEVELLFDPQTAGGLLLTVEPARAGDLVARLRDAGETAAATIGSVGERASGAPLLTLQ
jgi:selenide,water dikinase